jgi:hypothetical protein
MPTAIKLPSAAILRTEYTYTPDTGFIFRKSDGRRAFSTRVEGGYLNGKRLGRCLKAHRVAWKIYHGCDPILIDHINGDASDNRISNLRSVSSSQNQRNRKLPANNTSGVHGVTWSKKDNRWRAAMWRAGKRVSLGNFVDKQDAVNARILAERDEGYHANHGRLTSKVEAI